MSLELHVPLLDLRLQYQSIQAEIEPRVLSLMESQQFVLGPEVQALEEEIAEYVGTAYAVGVSSGTDALIASLMAAGIGPGDEVITTPYSFFATASSIARVGAKPVFVDIDPQSFNLDVQQIASAVTNKTRAIIPVHLFGQCADMFSILSFAKEKDLVVIEDAAQAIGARYENSSAGSFGDYGCFSFFPSKNLGGFGDGGMVTVRKREHYEKLCAMRQHGEVKKYHHQFIGGNFRLDALQAAVLRIKLKYLDSWAEGRRENAGRYCELFSGAGISEFIALPEEQEGNFHIYNQFVIRAKERDSLLHYLRERNIGAAIYYPLPLHLQECFSYLGYRPGDLPVSEQAAKETLALPIFPELEDAQIACVVETIQSFYAAG